MKCVRDTGLGGHWATWQKRAKEYSKRYWKRSCPYTVRCRTCARALHMIDIQTRKNIRARKSILWALTARLWHFKSDNSYKNKVKWQ